MGTTFVPIARYESEGLGLPGLPLAVVPYPMGGVPEEEARRRASRALDEVLAGLTVQPAESEATEVVGQ